MLSDDTSSIRVSRLSPEDREACARRCDEIAEWAARRRMPFTAARRREMAAQIRAGGGSVAPVLLRVARAGAA